MLRDRSLERIQAIQSNSQAEEKVVDEVLGDLRQRIEEKRILAPTRSQAEYDEDSKTITVTRFAGKLMKNMGYSESRSRLLYPEEALFLMEAASLELVHNGIPLDLNRAYALFMGKGDLSWDQYAVYCHLTRAGYVVVRFKGPRDSLDNLDDAKGSSRSTRELDIVYDVHLADSGFSITKNQRPDHRVVIMRVDDDTLSMDELRLLHSRTSDDAPVHAAVVDQTEILYFSIDCVEVPDIG